MSIPKMGAHAFFERTPEPYVLVVGRRDAGKSTLAADLLSHYGGENRARGRVMTSAASDRDAYRRRDVPNIEYDVSYTDIIGTPISPYLKGFRRSFVVFDNCFCDHSWTYEYAVRNFFSYKSYCKCLLVLAITYPMLLPPEIRGKLDYVCIFRETDSIARKRLFAQYGEGLFPDYAAFCAALDASSRRERAEGERTPANGSGSEAEATCTAEAHTCLVIRLRGRTSAALCDNVFAYRAKQYDYAAARARMDVHREALAAAAFHPRRLARWLESAEAGRVEDDWMP